MGLTAVSDSVTLPPSVPGIAVEKSTDGGLSMVNPTNSTNIYYRH